MSLAISEAVENQNALGDHAGQNRESARSHRVSWKPFQHLLWREWRTLRWWVFASLGLTLSIMLLYVLPVIAHPLTEERENREIQLVLFLQSMLAPTMFLIGALVGCFASEREESNLQWCNSLPIHWAPSLGVKLLCTLVGAVWCAAIAWCFAAGLESCLSVPADKNLPHLQNFLIYTRIQTSIEWIAKFSLLLFPLSLLCLLLAKRVANGALAAIAASICCIAFGLSIPTVFQSHEIGQGNFADLGLRFLIEPTFAGTACLLLAAIAYRWRWSTGMYSSFWSWSIWSRTEIKKSRSADVWPRPWTAPHAGRVLYWVAWRRVRSAWIGLSLAAVAVLLGSHLSFSGLHGFSILIPLGYLLFALFVGLGAIWNVHGEQGGEAEGFLSERGVSPTHYWWTRYFVSVIGGTGVLGIVLLMIVLFESCFRYRTLPFLRWQEMSNFVTTLILGVHALALVGLLAGQAFRSWQVAVFAVAYVATLMGFLVNEAAESSGYHGLFVCLGLVATAAPLSWWITKATFVQWQANLGRVFVLYTAALLLVVALTIPWVRVWVLPTPTAELADPRVIPPFVAPRWTVDHAIILGTIHSDLTNGQQYDFQRMIELRNEELTRQGNQLMTPTRYSAAISLRESAEMARQRLLEILNQQTGDLVTESEEIFVGISDLRRISRQLNEIAFATLEIGDSGTTEVTLKLRRGLLDCLQPVTGLYGFDSIQLEFYNGLETKLSSQGLRILQELHRNQPTLLGGQVEQANKDWIESMKAQFSYLFRYPRGTAALEMQQDNAVGTSAMVYCDELMSQAISVRSFHDRTTLLKLILPEPWWDSAEEARFRREISHAYRIFLDYLQTYQLTDVRMPNESEIGELNSRQELFKQIEIWDMHRRSLASLLTRLEQASTEK